jgi:hypothetical protein
MYTEFIHAIYKRNNFSPQPFLSVFQSCFPFSTFNSIQYQTTIAITWQPQLNISTTTINQYQNMIPLMYVNLSNHVEVAFI